MKRMVWQYTLAVATLALGPMQASAQRAGGSVVFRNVSVFDGVALHERTTVVVLDGWITAVDPDARIPSGVPIVDGSGRTLLPGLIESHGHFGGEPETLKQALLFGVTTSLDMWANPEQVAARRAEQKSTGAFDRSDVFSAGTLVTYPGGHLAAAQFGLSLPTITRPAEAQQFVDDRIAEGSDYIKIVYDAYGADPERTDSADFSRGRWPSIGQPTLAAVIRAAHARGKLAVVHALNLRSARHALEAGADGLVHLFSDAPADADFVRTAAARGLFIIPTMVLVTPALALSELLDDPLITDYFHPARLGSLRQITFGVAPPAVNVLDTADATRRIGWIAASVRTLHANGVRLLAGTDPPNPGVTYGASLHEELVRLVDAGLSPIDALRSATSVPVDAFGLADRGRIVPGSRADLVLVRGDPTTDIRVSRNIAGVWKLGVPMDREAYAATSAPQRDAWRALQRPGVSLISDFETDDAGPTAVVGSWGTITDAYWGGRSTATLRIVSGGANGTGKALSITGTLIANGPDTFAGPTYRPWGPVDLSSKSELVFWARGNGSPARVIAFEPNPGGVRATHEFVVGSEWTEIVVPLSGLEPVYPRHIQSFVFTGPATGGDFTLQIDDVRLR